MYLSSGEELDIDQWEMFYVEANDQATTQVVECTFVPLEHNKIQFGITSLEEAGIDFEGGGEMVPPMRPASNCRVTVTIEVRKCHDEEPGNR